MASTILYKTVIMLILIGVGVICAKTKLISETSNKDLSKFVLQVVNPVVIFMSYQTEYRSELVKNLLHLPFGHSAGVGELCNFLLGGVFAFVAGLVYHRGKNRRTAAWGAILGAVAMAAASLPLNYFLVYPAYVVLYHMPLDAIVGAYEAILGTIAHIPTDNALLNCLVVFNVPFTLVKGLIDVVLCFLIYKPLSPLLHK